MLDLTPWLDWDRIEVTFRLMLSPNFGLFIYKKPGSIYKFLYIYIYNFFLNIYIYMS